MYIKVISWISAWLLWTKLIMYTVCRAHLHFLIDFKPLCVFRMRNKWRWAMGTVIHISMFSLKLQAVCLSESCAHAWKHLSIYMCICAVPTHTSIHPYFSSECASTILVAILLWFSGGVFARTSVFWVGKLLAVREVYVYPYFKPLFCECKNAFLNIRLKSNRISVCLSVCAALLQT